MSDDMPGNVIRILSGAPTIVCISNNCMYLQAAGFELKVSWSQIDLEMDIYALQYDDYTFIFQGCKNNVFLEIDNTSPDLCSPIMKEAS